MRLREILGERLARSSALALTADLVGKTGTLLLTLATARLLSVREFARFAVCLALIAVLTALFDAGAQTLLTRDGAAAPERRRGLLSALTKGRLPLAAFAVAIAVPVGRLTLGETAMLASVGIALTAAVALSLSGLCRSDEQMRPETNARLVLALLQLVAIAAAWLFRADADRLLVLLLAANAIALIPFLRPAQRLLGGTTSEKASSAVRRAAPFGLMALATIVFYRAGTLVLGAFSSARETAVFSVASNLSFALLALPNAITTGLLPRLAATHLPSEQAALARRALIWTFALTLPLALATAGLGPVVLPLVLGRVYGAAAAPLAVLIMSVLLIAVSGIAGTLLIVRGRTRALALQVFVSLGVNLLALVLLIPALGAFGAALATLLCESVGLVLLIPPALRALPELRHPSTRLSSVRRDPAQRRPAGATSA